MNGKTLFVDPGDMVGWALGEDGEVIESGQTPLWHFIDAVYDGVSGTPWYPGQKNAELVELVTGIVRIVAEDFLIDPRRCKSLANDPVRTARGLGALQLIARVYGLDYKLQRNVIKPTAEAAGAAELFETPLHENRHANDAVRHLVYYYALEGVGGETKTPEDPERG